MVSDMVFSFEDIRTDLMLDATPDSIMQYYDECVEEGMKAMDEGRDARYVNYRNWLLGARIDPKLSSEEYLTMMEIEQADMAKRIAKQKEALEKLMREQFQRDADDLLANSDGLF
jgi:hypothetical protein